MLLVTTLASFVVLATGIVADAADPSNYRRSHSHSLSITKRIDPRAKYNPVQRDRKRFTHLINNTNQVSSGSSNLAEETAESPLTDAGACYEANVGIGNPPTYCKSCVNFLSGHSLLHYGPSFLDSLVVDTGSSNTWVGANTPYVKTYTSVNTSYLVVSSLHIQFAGPAQTKNGIYQSVEYGSASFNGKLDFS